MLIDHDFIVWEVTAVTGKNCRIFPRYLPGVLKKESVKIVVLLSYFWRLTLQSSLT